MTPDELIARAREVCELKDHGCASRTLLPEMADALVVSKLEHDEAWAEVRVWMSTAAEATRKYNALLDTRVAELADAYDKGRTHGDDDRVSEDG